MSQKVLRIEMDRLCVALARFHQMSLTKLHESQGLLCRNILWIFLENMIEEGLGIRGPLIISKEIGSNRVSLYRSQSLHLEGGIIDLGGCHHLEITETALPDVAFQRCLQLL